MHRKELDYLKKESGTQGVTLVPLKLYWQRGKVKVLVGVATGKKNIDKRQTIKERDWSRQQHRILKKNI
jgi:SsrA-binding protein